MAGTFEYLQEDAPDGTVRIPCGQTSNGTSIVEPAPMPTPVFPLLVPPAPNPPAAGNNANAAPQQDPIALINSAMAAMQAMVQMNIQADARSAAIARQQMDLQAATLKSSAQQLGQLTSAMGNLGHDVGKAIASHPPPTIQATLSHSNVAPGQLMNPREMGSLT